MPEPALAIPGIPSPQDIVSDIVQWLFKTFLGIDAKIGRRALNFLVAHPIYTDRGDYPEPPRRFSQSILIRGTSAQ